MVLPWESVSEPPPPVLVLGMHNSGTTMLAQILHHSGLFLANNAAHCESHFFSLFINDRLIMGGGTAWAQVPIMTVEQVLARREVVEPLVRQYWRMDYIQWGYDGCGPWGIKDPRLCVVLPLYLEMFPAARLLLIRRDPDDVAASLAHRSKPGVGVKNDPQHWKSLTVAHLERVEQYAQGRPYLEVEYERLCREPVSAAEPVFQFLELPYDQRARERVRATVKTDRIGTRHWSETRWRCEKAKRRFKELLGPLYYALLRRK
jgi:hypothetical protein